jgi:NAD+ kinase
MIRVALFAHVDRAAAVSAAEYTAQRLLEERASVFAPEGLIRKFGPSVAERVTVQDAESFGDTADVMITFGGDGTLLAAAHMVFGSDVPIMGVNVGHLGFLAEFAMPLLDEAIMDVMKGNYRIVDRTTVEAVVDEQRFFGLNEILIEKSATSSMITVRAFVNDHHVADYRADGVIVATPTGSTAYSLAAGGPIMVPSARTLCLTPISPHTLTLRPLIVQDDAEIRFELPNEAHEAQLVADGTIGTMLRPGMNVVIRKSEHLLKLIKRADSTYYDLLREKLLWAADVGKR